MLWPGLGCSGLVWGRTNSCEKHDTCRHEKQRHEDPELMRHSRHGPSVREFIKVYYAPS